MLMFILYLSQPGYSVAFFVLLLSPKICLPNKILLEISEHYFSIVVNIFSYYFH